MIRRLIAATVLAAGALVFAAGPAGADNGNIVCLYARDPKPGIGLCIGMP